MSQNTFSLDNIEVLRDNLRRGICFITFEKKDGTLREMSCTLDPQLLPPVEAERSARDRGSVLSVWDTELKAWRSFDVNRLRSFAGAPPATEALRRALEDQNDSAR